MMFDLGYRSTQYRSKREGYMGTSLQQMFAMFPDEDACFRHVFDTRYGQSWPCPRCRKAGSWYRIRNLRRMQHPCGYGISPLGNSIFHKSQIPLQLWFYTMLHFANSAEGVNSTFLQRHLGIASKAAFRLTTRIRIHLASLEAGRRLGGAGKSVQVKIIKVKHVRRKDKSNYPAKLIILADSDSVSGAVVDVSRRHILSNIINDIVIGGSALFTCCPYTHKVSSEFGLRRPLLKYIADYNISEDAKKDGITGFVTYFTRPFRYFYRSVDQENLWLYFAEALFRYNRRARSDCIFGEMIGSFPRLDSAAGIGVMRRFSRLASNEDIWS